MTRCQTRVTEPSRLRDEIVTEGDCEGPRRPRAARYVCELVALAGDGREVRGTGVLPGRIAPHAAGSEGFGYDPIFVPDGETRTVAELGNGWKRAHSHRARAARVLAVALRHDLVTKS